MKRQELLNFCQNLLTPQLFEDYCPNGLQIEGVDNINKVAFAVSATKDSIEKASHWGAQALMVHHGLFWKHQGAKTLTGPYGQRVLTLARAEINLLAYHLPLDAHREVGNAVAMAHKMGLEKIEPFGLYKKNYLGAQGEFSLALTGDELKVQLERILNKKIIHAKAWSNKKIKTVGIITGGANREWVMAHDLGLDAYLTGEISEYDWHDASEADLHYFAGGHHATEKWGIQLLMNKIESHFPELEVYFIDSENPA